jgi:hypothetical protein
MHNSNIPEDRELPSTIKLLKSALIAALCAIVLLVTVVLPADYGVDPTGIGKLLGLKEMGEIKAALAAELAADNALHAGEGLVHGPDTHTHDNDGGHMHEPDTHTHDNKDASEEDHVHGPDTHTH